MHSSRRISRPYPVLRHVVDDSKRRRTFFSRRKSSGGSGAAAPDGSAHGRGAGPLTPQPTRRGGSSRKARRLDELRERSEGKRKRDQRTEGPAATGATPDGAKTLQAAGEASEEAKEKSAGGKTPGGIEASGATGGDTTGSGGSDGQKGFVQLSGAGARPKAKALLLVPSNAALGQRRKTYDFPNLPEGTVSLQGCAVPEFTGALAFKLYQLEWGKAFRQLVSWLS